jgi:hypothetical protein
MGALLVLFLRFVPHQQKSNTLVVAVFDREGEEEALSHVLEACTGCNTTDTETHTTQQSIRAPF